MTQVLALGWPGPFEMVILAGFGLLIFGKRLPEVGRSIGKTIVEFKKGMKEVENEMAVSDDATSPSRPAPAPGYKFDPYTGKPIGSTVESTTTSPPPTV